jgi:hypothetical protein
MSSIDTKPRRDVSRRLRPMGRHRSHHGLECSDDFDCLSLHQIMPLLNDFVDRLGRSHDREQYFAL